jgi:hypothetical protein
VPLTLADVDVGVVLGLVSLTGLTGIGVWRVTMRFSRRNRFLRLRVNEPLDIVLSTSRVERSTQPVSYRRTLISVGHLESVTAFSAAVGAIKRRDQIVVHASSHVAHALERDLVLIGGPVKNEISRLFLERLDLAYPDLGLLFGPGEDGVVRVAVDGTAFDVEPPAGELSCDYGLVVAWVNPFAVERRRAILCAGITSHGTAAAATYLLGPVIDRRYRRLRSDAARGGRRGARWDWPSFVLLLKLVVGSDGRFGAVEELAFVPLDPPGDAQLPIAQPMRVPAARLRAPAQ